MESARGHQSAMTPSAITARVVTDAKRAFSSLRDDAQVERVARQAVDEFWQDQVKVTAFIPVLAIRRVRDLLEQQSGNTSATTPR